ncbi:glycosyltransferase [Schleiferiaceae bacterium]|nr:glycosyltransferase [Schleiferiaceae bacterium]
MLKILVDAHVFDENYFQGTTSYIKGLYMNNPYLDVTLAARDEDNLKSIFGNEIKTVKLRHSSRFGRLFIDFPRLFSVGNYDLVHFQYIASPLLYNYSIVTIHDVLFKDYGLYFKGISWQIKDISYWITYKLSRHILTVSEYSKNRLLSHYGAKTIGVTENMFDRRIEEKNNPGVNGKFILVVSRDEKRKRLDLLEVLLDRMDAIQLVVVTNSDRFQNRSRVISFSSLDQSQLNWLFANCHFSIFPSECEGFGMPIIESLVSGRIVLARNASAMSTLKIPDECFFIDDWDLVERARILWYRSRDENRVYFSQYNDWDIPQRKLYNMLLK